VAGQMVCQDCGTVNNPTDQTGLADQTSPIDAIDPVQHTSPIDAITPADQTNHKN